VELENFQFKRTFKTSTALYVTAHEISHLQINSFDADLVRHKMFWLLIWEFYARITV